MIRERKARKNFTKDQIRGKDQGLGTKAIQLLNIP